MLFLKSCRKEESEDLVFKSVTNSGDIIIHNQSENYDANFMQDLNKSEFVDDFCFVDSPDVKHVKSKVKKLRERRVTLSPASAMAAICEVETQQRRASVDFSLVPLDLSEIDSLIEPIPLIMEVDPMYILTQQQEQLPCIDLKLTDVENEVSNEDKLINEFRNELDLLLSNDIDEVSNDCAVNETDSLSNNIQSNLSMDVEGPVHEIHESSIDDEETDTIIVLTPSCIQGINNMNIDDYLTINQQERYQSTCPESDIMSCMSADDFISSTELNAYSRLCFRMDQAKWKYQWEVVSAQAAMKARVGSFLTEVK